MAAWGSCVGCGDTNKEICWPRPCDFVVQEAEARRSLEFQAILGYRARHCLTQNNAKGNRSLYCNCEPWQKRVGRKLLMIEFHMAGSFGLIFTAIIDGFTGAWVRNRIKMSYKRKFKQTAQLLLLKSLQIQDYQ